MTTRRPGAGRGVAVIGGGIAGTGAAVAAAKAGAEVVLFDGGPGASLLASGGLDGDMNLVVTSFLSSFGGYCIGSHVRLVTTAGVVRGATAYDAALLDVSMAGGDPVGVVDCDRPGWDARALARAWGDGFEVVEATVLRHTDERVLPDADFAARHDDAERLAWLGARLREAIGKGGGRLRALLLPSCLGIERARARELLDIAGIPCGEAIGLPGGPAGLRFERAKDRALAGARVTNVRERARALTKTERGWHVASEGQDVEVGAVVVATGGLLGGGIEYRSPAATEITEGGTLPAPVLRLTLDCPLVVGVNGKRLEAASSTYGAVPEGLAWPSSATPVLERAGAIVDGEGRGPAPGLFAAGDVVADAPRTWLRALASGLRAGEAAARFISGAA